MDNKFCKNKRLKLKIKSEKLRIFYLEKYLGIKI
jgi:hypothetical protein